MRALALLPIVALSVSGAAQMPLEKVVAQFRSPDQKVRHRAVDEYLRRSKGAILRYAWDGPDDHLAAAGRYLKEAVDAAEAKPEEVRERFLRMAKRVGSKDSDPVGEPGQFWQCGVGTMDRDRVDVALRYAVGRRPDTIRNLLADPKMPYKGVLFRQLWKLGDAQDQKIALRFLSSPELGLRVLGVEAMAALPMGRAQDEVLAAAKDENAWMRFSAAAALKTWGSERAEKALLALRNDRNSVVAYQANESLRAFDSEEVIEVYVRQIKGDEKARTEAASELFHHPNPRSIPALIQRIEADDFRFLPALAAIDDPKARETLLYVSEDHRSKVRAEALLAMAYAKGPEIEARLVRGLRDPNPDIVAAAMMTISKNRIRSALPTLWTMYRQRKGDEYGIVMTLRSVLGLRYDEPLPN